LQFDIDIPAILASIAVDSGDETELVLHTRSVMDLLLNTTPKETLFTLHYIIENTNM